MMIAIAIVFLIVFILHMIIQHYDQYDDLQNRIIRKFQGVYERDALLIYETRKPNGEPTNFEGIQVFEPFSIKTRRGYCGYALQGITVQTDDETTDVGGTSGDGVQHHPDGYIWHKQLYSLDWDYKLKTFFGRITDCDDYSVFRFTISEDFLYDGIIDFTGYETKNPTSENNHNAAFTGSGTYKILKSIETYKEYENIVSSGEFPGLKEYKNVV